MPVGILAVTMIGAYVHDHPEQVRSKRVDGVGIGLLILAVGAVQLMLERGERLDWFDSNLVTGLAVGLGDGRDPSRRGGSSGRTSRPSICRLLKSAQFSAGSAMGIVLGAGLFGSVFILPIFLQGMLHMTAWQTGLIILPGAIASAFSMAIAGRLSAAVDNRMLILMGSVFFAHRDVAAVPHHVPDRAPPICSGRSSGEAWGWG